MKVCIVFVFLFVSLSWSGMCLSSTPVPESKRKPTARVKGSAVPFYRVEERTEGELVTFGNSWLTCQVLVGDTAEIVSLKPSSGKELLEERVPCFAVEDVKKTIVQEGGMQFTSAWEPKQEVSEATVETSGGERGVLRDGKTFTVKRWGPRQHYSFLDIYIELQAPEEVSWTLRVYRDKPYIEQRFSYPPEWREDEWSVVQVLRTAERLKPIMPNNAFAVGMSGGTPNITGRHRFEYVDSSDHGLYDHGERIGLIGFVSGVGGEERAAEEYLALFDHGSEVLADEPSARFFLWPFDGPPEEGFIRLREFIAEEYSTQGDKYGPFSWNQFWLWQGGPQPAGSEVVTATRLLDILPHIAGLGCEEFHLDAGWEANRFDWTFDVQRFPEGYEPLRQLVRKLGMRYHTWMNTGATDDPGVIERLIDETDMCKLFQDRTTTEESIAAMRAVRKNHPGFETFAHHTTSRSRYYFWGNIHFLSDFNQVYFGEGQFWAWSNILPGNPDEGDVNKRFFSTHSMRAGDLITRSAAYQVHWAWPYRCVMPPHNGWCWFEDRPLEELASRMYTTIAARYDYQWGFDPRLVRQECLEFFLDWTAFFKAARPYLQSYQHILPVPDGIHPDGAAHLKDGVGFIVLCNPSNDPAEVDWKEILWEPELRLEPDATIEVTEWTSPLSPRKVGAVSVEEPTGAVDLEPSQYRVLGLNVEKDFPKKIERVRREIHFP